MTLHASPSPSSCSALPVCQAAVRQCGETSTQLWLRYCAFQKQQGRGAGQIHWRACRALKDASAFVAAAGS